MKKENISAFFKGKGFYAALAVGAASLLAVGIISTNMISADNKKEELAKNPSSQVAENARQQEGPDNKKESGTKKETPEKDVPAREKLTGNDTKKEPAKTDTKPEEKQDEEISDLVEPEATDKKASPEEETKPEAQEEAEEDVASVLSQDSQINNLSFQEEDGLLWPVQGEVILSYSMDKPVYFKTLAQYKCNSAVMIGAEENTEVVSAAKAVITDISEEDETGVTITASLGNDYQIIYGQLSDVQVNVGETVGAGAIIGRIAAPTKYYIEEGSNLYLKVLSGEEPINPLLLLE